MSLRAQAGLEYLMTYGWALVLIVSVASVLFFVISSPSSNVSFSSSDPTKILLRASNVSGTNAEIQLQNATGGKINITGITPTNYSNCTINGGTSLSVGAGSIMKLNCTAPSDNKGSIKIEYTDFAGLSRIITINASGSSSGTGETGLVAYYKFDEGTGTTATDSSGNGNNGTLLPTGSEPTWQTTGCPNGNCLSFDGVNDFVDIGDITKLNNAEEFTILGWAKQTNTGHTERIFNKRQNGSNDISIAPYGNALYIEVGNGANSFCYWWAYGSQIPGGTWYHFAATFDGAGATNADKVKLYINGLQKGLAFNGTMPTTTANMSGYNADIGKQGYAGEEYYGGTADEVKIYDRALSASEVCSVCKEHIPPSGACNCA